MEHILKLQPKYFDYINNGTKRVELLADKSITKQELLNVLEEFYTPEKQKQYGVVGIRIEKIY